MGVYDIIWVKHVRYMAESMVMMMMRMMMMMMMLMLMMLMMMMAKTGMNCCLVVGCCVSIYGYVRVFVRILEHVSVCE